MEPNETVDSTETTEHNGAKPGASDIKLPFSIENLLADKFVQSSSEAPLPTLTPEIFHLDNLMTDRKTAAHNFGATGSSEAVAATQLGGPQSEVDDDEEMGEDAASVTSSEHVDVESGPGGEVHDAEANFAQSGRLPTL